MRGTNKREKGASQAFRRGELAFSFSLRLFLISSLISHTQTNMLGGRKPEIAYSRVEEIVFHFREWPSDTCLNSSRCWASRSCWC
jgi:hypothetical protein